MTTTTTTNGVIAAAAQTKPQEAPAKATPAQMLNSLLNNGAIQQTLKSTLDKNAGAFAASVMNLFNNDTLLQQCEPRAVLAEALKAAAPGKIPGEPADDPEIIVDSDSPDELEESPTDLQ